MPLLQWRGHVAKQLVLDSGLGTGARCQRSGNGALWECRIGGIGSGLRWVLRRSHWLHVAPRRDAGLLYISALVPSGARGVLLKSKTVDFLVG